MNGLIKWLKNRIYEVKPKCHGQLIIGGPQTGKTTCLIENAKQMARNGKTVLIICFTHREAERVFRLLPTSVVGSGGITVTTQHMPNTALRVDVVEIDNLLRMDNPMRELVKANLIADRVVATVDLNFDTFTPDEYMRMLRETT